MAEQRFKLQIPSPREAIGKARKNLKSWAVFFCSIQLQNSYQHPTTIIQTNHQHRTLPKQLLVCFPGSYNFLYFNFTTPTYCYSSLPWWMLYHVKKEL